MKIFNVAFLGAGRMGMTHLRNLIGVPGVRVRVVADPILAAAQAGAAAVNAERASSDIEATINASDVDVVMIATPTGTHAELIERAVRAGKPVWCEKPVAMTLAGTEHVVQTVEASKHPVMIGFMRRFDPGYAAAKHAIEAGEVGRIERFRALSCDTTPPPLAFIKTSGGIFVDMMVHDFDMARFLVGEIEEVSAWGAALIDPGFAEAGDVDTCVAMLRFANGAVGTIEGTRRATWGYDIRTEIAGSKAKLVVEAQNKTPLLMARNVGHEGDYFQSFPDRFETAYKGEMAYFIDCLQKGQMPSPGVRDALASLRVALAATQSLREGRPVKISEVSAQ
ncbi:MAG: inositol 2-dehydrogenase [Chloroflexi bacterium]|nr:inositol 2-dehydrogenase [Chloroflexota bacterium]